MNQQKPRKELPAGTILRHGDRIYTIIDYISGSGGFSLTYVASDSDNPGQKVAIKELFVKDHSWRDENTGRVIPDDDYKAEFENSKHLFRAEGEKLMHLGVHHENIVRAYDQFEANGTAYLVMEYIDGVQLEKYLETKSVDPERDFPEFLRKLCGALAYLHSQKSICHCDLKPSNVMVENGTKRVVLIDFGNVRHYDADDRPTESSRMANCRSKGYTAPEFINGRGALTSAEGILVDVFGLGATIYRIITRTNPPEIPNDHATAEGLKRLTLQQYSSYVDVTRKAMLTTPADRIQSVAELARMLGFEISEYSSVFSSEGEEVVTTVFRGFGEEIPPTGDRDDSGLKEEPVEEPATEIRHDDGLSSVPTEGPTEPSSEKSSEGKTEVSASTKRKTEPGTKTARTGNPVPSEEKKKNSISRPVLISIIGVLAVAVCVLAGILVSDRRGGINPSPRDVALAPTESTELPSDPWAESLPEEDNAGENEEFLLPDDSIPGNNVDSVEGTPGEDSAAPYLETAVQEQHETPTNTVAPKFYKGNAWTGDMINGKPDGVGTLSVLVGAQLGDSTLGRGWQVRDAVFENGYFVSGRVYDAEGNYLYTYVP